MTDRDHLLQEIEAFIERSAISASKFGALAMNDTALVTRLKRGGDVRTETAEKLRAFMRNFPSNESIRRSEKGRAA